MRDELQTSARATGAGSSGEARTGERTREPVRGLYGRRRGHPLSARQAGLVEDLYPRLAPDLSRPPPDPLTGLFGGETRAVWLEIGFGGGEHLVRQAARHPDTGLIGCEPFENGMAKALAAVEETGLANVRLHLGDARDVIDWLPPGSLSRVFLLYPDPWPKKRHFKRRFVSMPTLDRLARAMAPGAELRFASDIDSYVEWTVDHMARHPRFRPAPGDRDPLVPWEDWASTRYEEKALREGRVPRYLSFLAT